MKKISFRLFLLISGLILIMNVTTCDSGNNLTNNLTDTNNEDHFDPALEPLSDSRFNGKFIDAYGDYWIFDGTHRAQFAGHDLNYGYVGIKLDNNHFWWSVSLTNPGFDNYIWDTPEDWTDTGEYSFDVDGNLTIWNVIFYKASTQFGTPTNVIASPLYKSGQAIQINWLPVFDAVGYYIYRSDSNSGAFTLIGTATTGSYLDSSLALNTTYYYKVSAYNNKLVESAQSTIVSATTFSVAPPDAPQNVTVSKNGATPPLLYTVNVSWSAVPGATSYTVIDWGWGAGGGSGGSGITHTTTYTSITLEVSFLGAGPYYYQVYATNEAGIGSYSARVSITLP